MKLHQKQRGHDLEVSTACFKIIINFLKGKSTKNKSHITEMMAFILPSSVRQLISIVLTQCLCDHVIQVEETELIEDVSVENALSGIAKENP